MIIKNKSKQVLPFMVYDYDGKHVQKILRPGMSYELDESEVTPDVRGKIRKKLFVVVGT